MKLLTIYPFSKTHKRTAALPPVGLTIALAVSTRSRLGAQWLTNRPLVRAVPGSNPY